MWHVLRKYNRVVARNVPESQCEYLIQALGGSIEKVDAPGLVGFIENENPIYNSPQLIIEADGVEIARVTRKKDAFAIMNGLKRDYTSIKVRLNV